MKIICAWCKRELGEKPGPPELISHGICPECKEKAEQELEKTMDPEIRSTLLINYDGEQYEIQYIYYSIDPDDFEVQKIYDASGEEIDGKLYDEIELWCQTRILEHIREDLMTRAEEFRDRITGR